MNGQFRLAHEVEKQDVGMAVLGWICHPASTRARQLVVVVEGSFPTGQGHSFHKHPDQEELIYVISGTVEQWVGREMRMLGPGDAAFMPAGTVHASLNGGGGEARLPAIFGPSLGAGFETIEMAGEVPWSTLRVQPVAV